MFTRLITFVFTCALLLAAEARIHPSRVHTDSNNCECINDNNGEMGLPINTYPIYQCVFPTGRCAWDVTTGELQSDGKNCPKDKPCTTDGLGCCICPKDNNGVPGILSDKLTSYQCVYTKGACTWDSHGRLENTLQTNCPTRNPTCDRPRTA